MFKILKHEGIKGYLPKRSLPTTTFIISYTPILIPIEKIQEFDEAIIGLLNNEKNVGLLLKPQNLLKALDNDEYSLLKRICLIIDMSLEKTGLPKANIAVKRLKKDKQVLFQLTCEELDHNQSYILQLIRVLIHITNHLNQEKFIISKSLDEYNKLLSTLPLIAPQGVNTLRFIEAARELKIPVRKVVNNIFQFGWGRKSRWLDSSFSDETPAISANLAKNKIFCSQYLRQAGFPIPKNYIVKDPAHASKIANKLSYPVVIKPMDLDQGVGVYSDLKNDKEVKDAFEKAKKKSNLIMIEEYIAGKDYRLQVFENEVYWAIERQGPKVVGNGIDNIEKLILSFNKKRTIENEKSKLAFPLIQLNEDIKDYLKLNGFDLDHVPNKGQLIKLRAANNISGGGTMTPVLDVAHPDNLDLAIEVSRFLRLDIAGIDLILPDIRVSWKEQKCGICEVNAKPQISGDRHKYLLKKMLPSKGRIPTFLFLTASEISWPYKNIYKLSESRKINIGIATKNGAWVNQSKKHINDAHIHSFGVHLISDPIVDAIFFHIDSTSKLLSQFPVDKFDAIVLQDNIMGNLKTKNDISLFKNIASFTNCLICMKNEGGQIESILDRPELIIKKLTEEELYKFLNDYLNDYAINKTIQ